MKFESKFDLGDKRVRRLEVAHIRRFSDNPRTEFDGESIRELAISIEKYGQSDPILVRELDHPDGCILYEIVKGERRWLAMQQLGRSTIDAIIIEVENTIQQYLWCLGTDIQNASLTELEIAFSIQKLQKMAMDNDEIARHLGKKTSWVDRHAVILKLSPKILRLFSGSVPESNRLLLGHAQLLSSLDEEKQIEFSHTISGHQLSVADARRLIAKVTSDRGISHDRSGAKSLRLIADLGHLLQFLSRTNEYIQNLLDMDDARFRDILRGGLQKRRRVAEMSKDIASGATALTERAVTHKPSSPVVHVLHKFSGSASLLTSRVAKTERRGGLGI